MASTKEESESSQLRKDEQSPDGPRQDPSPIVEAQNEEQHEVASDPDIYHYRGIVPPVFTIDLSLPPRSRYTHVIESMKPQLQSIPALVDETLARLRISRRAAHLVVRTLFRNYHDKEELEELRGIQYASGLPMYMLLAFNVTFDIIPRCTSGGITVNEPGSTQRMMHYRTMDLGGLELRELIVQYEYKEAPDGPVIARAVTYAGVTGILTGVRKGLSVSLNGRGQSLMAGDSKFKSRKARVGHSLRVLGGRRPLLGTHLRRLVLPQTVPIASKDRKWMCKKKIHQDQVSILRRPEHTLDEVIRSVPAMPTASAYLIFCDSSRTAIMEKNNRTANVYESDSFLVVANADSLSERARRDAEQQAEGSEKPNATPKAHPHNRQRQSTPPPRPRLHTPWKLRAKIHTRIWHLQDRLVERFTPAPGPKTMRPRTQTEKKIYKRLVGKHLNDGELWLTTLWDYTKDGNADFAPTMSGLRRFLGVDVPDRVQASPLIRDDTHFLCVMDPMEGTIECVYRFEDMRMHEGMFAEEGEEQTLAPEKDDGINVTVDES